MAKVKIVESTGSLSYRCPGCGIQHSLVIDNLVKGSWLYNDDPDFPTLTPSIKIEWADKHGKRIICHHFITNGVIDFLWDCTHELRGKQEILEEID